MALGLSVEQALGESFRTQLGGDGVFLLQIPVSIFAFIVGHIVIKETSLQKALIEDLEESRRAKISTWRQIDLSGAGLLVLGLSAQLAALSMGGNNYAWSDIRVISSFVISVVLLAIFVLVELRTEAIPVMPMSMLQGTLAISNLVTNVCLGMAAYSVSMLLLIRETWLVES